MPSEERQIKDTLDDTACSTPSLKRKPCIKAAKAVGCTLPTRKEDVGMSITELNPTISESDLAMLLSDPPIAESLRRSAPSALSLEWRQSLQ